MPNTTKGKISQYQAWSARMTATKNALIEKPIKVPACSCRNVRAADPALAVRTGIAPSTTQNACSTLNRRVSRTARPIVNPDRTAAIQAEGSARSTALIGFACALAPLLAVLLCRNGIQITSNAGCAMMPANIHPARYGNTEPRGAGMATANMNDRSNTLRIGGNAAAGQRREL
jgi:hypothetical protein